MNGLFYFGFFLFVASTVLFIVSILTRYWILDNNKNIRGIFEYCTPTPNDQLALSCKYIFTYSDNYTSLRPG
jgi:hypothetical protein